MSILESLATSNLPGAVGIVVALMLVAAYLVFVVPLMKENELLKNQVKSDLTKREDELKDLIGEVKELVKTNPEVTELFTKMIDSHKENNQLIMEQLTRLHNDTQHIIEELMTREEVEAFIEYIKNNANEIHNKDSMKFNQICDLLNSIKAISDDIKDKQSTLNGALFMSGNSHRGIK